MNEPDTTMFCLKCDRRERVNFSYCLRHGWPECHGLGMTLLDTKANIAGAVEDAFAAANTARQALSPDRETE